MQKMFVRLNDVKIANNVKYNKFQIWQMIDIICEKHRLHKVILTDNSRAYYVATNREKQLRYFDIPECCKSLRLKDWFAQSIEKWIAYGNKVNLDEIKISLNCSEFKANYEL